MWPVDFVRHDDTDDESVKTEGGAKDLNDEHAHESAWSLGVRESSSRANDADTHSAEEVGEAYDESSSESSVS